MQRKIHPPAMGVRLRQPSRLLPLLSSAASLSFVCTAAFAADPDIAKTGDISTVVVEADADGSAANGYRVNAASFGALGAAALKDAPYTVTVAPEELMENLQASTVSDALKFTPAVYGGSGNNMVGGGAAFTIRGFTTNTNESFVDGLRIYSRTPIEDKERVEVIEGATSFLFGFANPAGTINYVQKRPTERPMLVVTTGTYGDNQWFTHADAGGPLDGAGKLAYRLNLLYVGKGDVGIKDDSHERYLGSGSLDWHVDPQTTISFDYAHYRINVDGGDNIFTVKSGVTAIPQAPKASWNFMPSFSAANDGYDRVATHFTNDLSDAITLRGAFSYSEISMFRHRASDAIIDNAGDYTLSRNYYDTAKYTADGYLYADYQTSILGLANKVTLGVNEENTTYDSAYPYANGNVGYAGTFNLYRPASFPADKYASTLGKPSKTTERTNLASGIVADRLDFDERWSLMAGVTIATIDDRNWDFSQYAGKGIYSEKPAYQETVPSPGAAVLFKPIPAVTTYVSYNEALQKGATSSTTTDINYGQSLSPYVARQVELGVKAEAGGMQVNAALFRIEQAYAYSQPLTGSATLYTEDGTETHLGGEISATGRLTDALTVTGGLTLLSAHVGDVTTAGLEDKVPAGVPRQAAKVYAEYAVPLLTGATLTGGITYSGPVYVNATNSLAIPSVVTGDIGARYRTEIHGTDTTLRINVTNVGNANYWTSSGGSLALGQARTVLFSTEFSF